MERKDGVRTATKIGILGCGVISGIYIETARKIDAIECVAVADVEPAAARYRADQYDIPRACSPHELLADALHRSRNSQLPADRGIQVWGGRTLRHGSLLPARANQHVWTSAERGRDDQDGLRRGGRVRGCQAQSG